MTDSSDKAIGRLEGHFEDINRRLNKQDEILVKVSDGVNAMRTDFAVFKSQTESFRIELVNGKKSDDKAVFYKVLVDFMGNNWGKVASGITVALGWLAWWKKGGP